jgi:acetyl-CoA C-acetyltransferase
VGDAVIIDGVRTPVGRYGGALSAVRPDDLAALVLRALVDRVGLDPADLEDVYLGCANQAGEDNRNVARMALLLAGFPVEVGDAPSTGSAAAAWRRSPTLPERSLTATVGRSSRAEWSR